MSDTPASISAMAKGGAKGAAPAAMAITTPASTPMPPMRGIGLACKERSFGWSSGRRAA